jgi:hypothetical protein
VCAHGGVILDESGEIDEPWRERMTIAARPDGPVLHDLANAFQAAADEMGVALTIRVLTEDGLPLYVLVKHLEADDAALEAIADRITGLLPDGWIEHRNGNNVALMPPWLGKAHAVAHLIPGLRRLHPDLPVIGVGDSRTDAPFMRLCDFAMMPTRSQIAGMTLDAL